MKSYVTGVFLAVENWHKAPVKILAGLFRGGPWPLRPQSGCATDVDITYFKFVRS